MRRTRLCERRLPDYTRGEEVFNMVSHIVGAAFGAAALVACVFAAAAEEGLWSLVSAAVYGGSLILLYTMSSVYHGLPAGMGKKVMQVLDHCSIYFLIAGSYTPIALGPLRAHSPALGWGILGFVWACAAAGAVFTAIDLKKYAVLSMVCYMVMGWCVLFALKPLLAAVPLPCVLWLLSGGIAYTLGAVLYGLGRKRRYLHSVFHLFVLAGSALQFVAIWLYVF